MTTYIIADPADEYPIIARAVGLFQPLSHVRSIADGRIVDTVTVRSTRGLATMRFIISTPRAGQVLAGAITPTPISGGDAAILVLAIGGLLVLAWSQSA
jgi:hypothetical protein